MKYCFCLGPPSILLAWIQTIQTDSQYSRDAWILTSPIFQLESPVLSYICFGTSPPITTNWHTSALFYDSSQHWWLNPHHPTQPSGQIELYNIMCYVEIKQHQNKEFCSEYVRHKIYHIRFHHTLKTTFNWLLKINVFQPLLCIIHKNLSLIMS